VLGAEVVDLRALGDMLTELRLSGLSGRWEGEDRSRYRDGGGDDDCQSSRQIRDVLSHS